MNEDGDQLQDTDSIGTGNDDRVARLNAIADQTDADRAEEFANVNDDGSTEPFAVDAEQPASVESTAEEDSATAADDDAAPATSEKTYRIKVNGKELELTESQLIARAQKIEAADEYLRQAAEVKRRLDAPPPAAPAQPTIDQNELQRRQDDEDRALVRAIQVGTEEEAAAALRKLREQLSARPSINKDDVSRTIDERLAFNTAIDKFSSEYADVWNDPILKKVALDRDAQLLKEGDRRPYWDRYASIGEEIRAWKQSIAPAVKPEATMTEKAERKASAPKVPAAVASAKSRPVKAEEDDVDDSPTAVIAAMAQRRGGPQWMRS